MRIQCGGTCVSTELRKLARGSVVAPESLGTLWPSEAVQRLQMAGDAFPKASSVQESLRARTGLSLDSNLEGKCVNEQRVASEPQEKTRRCETSVSL